MFFSGLFSFSNGFSIAAGIIYLILAILTGVLWPLDLLGGKAGPLGFLFALGWIGLLIASWAS